MKETMPRIFTWLAAALLVLAPASTGCGGDEPNSDDHDRPDVSVSVPDVGTVDAPDVSLPLDACSSESCPGDTWEDDGGLVDSGTPDTGDLEDVSGGGEDADVHVPDVVEELEPRPLGGPCSDVQGCEEGLLCFQGLNTDGQGFCTRRCETPGTGCGYVGPNLSFECALADDTGPICGFICVLDHGDHTHSYSCPSGDWGRLRCQNERGPGNHRYCAPR